MGGGLDSPRAWGVVAAAFAALFVAFGIAYSYGAFLEEMRADFGVGRAAGATFFSLTSLLYFGLGGVSGAAGDRFGQRRVLLVGASAGAGSAPRPARCTVFHVRPPSDGSVVADRTLRRGPDVPQPFTTSASSSTSSRTSAKGAARGPRLLALAEVAVDPAGLETLGQRRLAGKASSRRPSFSGSGRPRQTLRSIRNESSASA